MTTSDTVQEKRSDSCALNMQSNLDTPELMARAVGLCVDNFNSHRKAERSPELTPSGVSMIWFTQGIIGFKAMFQSPLARGILWYVTFNRPKGQMFLEVFSKMKNVKMEIGV